MSPNETKFYGLYRVYGGRPLTAKPREESHWWRRGSSDAFRHIQCDIHFRNATSFGASGHGTINNRGTNIGRTCVGVYEMNGTPRGEAWNEYLGWPSTCSSNPHRPYGSSRWSRRHLSRLAKEEKSGGQEGKKKTRSSKERRIRADAALTYSRCPRKPTARRLDTLCVCVGGGGTREEERKYTLDKMKI